MKVTDIRPHLGTDPELFVATNGKIVGSERLITEKGLAGYGGAVVPDGVQIELHPGYSTCRQSLASFLANSLELVRAKMAAIEGMSVSFEAVVKISQEELDALSERSKVFGCARSENAYNKGADVKINAATYLKRHAGGHIHLGLTDVNSVYKVRQRLVPLEDAFVGNTCVLLDRNPEAAERRLHYGRAGEYRLPQHGLEYRTLSNFWLRSYPLMSLVFGIARQPVGILYDSLLREPFTWGKDGTFEEQLLKAVNLDEVQKAINTNDVELAWKNFEGVKKFIVDNVEEDNTGLSPNKLKAFEFFAKKIQSDGLEYWFPEAPMTHWCNFADPRYSKIPRAMGWESFVRNTVEPRRLGY